MSAILTILGDASGVTRAIGEAVGQARRATSALGAESERRRRIEREEIEDARSAFRGLLRDRQRAALARQRAEEAASKRRRQIERDEVADARNAFRGLLRERQRAERERTKTTEREGKLRQKIEDNAKKASEKLEREKTRTHEREEKERTRNAEKAEKERTRFAERQARARIRTETRLQRENRGIGEGTRRVLGTVWSAGSAGARDLHGQFQDARRQRARTRLTLSGKLGEAGATRSEADALFETLSTHALSRGMSADDLAGAVAAAQTEFSVLGSTQELRGMNPQQRMNTLRGNLYDAIERAAQGRNLGADPGEFLRLAGMFGQQGFAGGEVDDLLARTVAMAQRGAIEPGAVTRQAMTPIMQRMQAAMGALGPNASAADRTAAARGAYIQSFAELQVLRSRGWNPRNGANAMASLDQALTGNTAAGRMQNNLEVVRDSARGENGRQLRGRVNTLLGTGEGGLFEDDPERRGQRRLRAQYRGNAVALSAALAAAGLSGEQTSNIFAGGGHGNAQGLQDNWRRLMRSMLGTNTEGVTGFAAVGELGQANLTNDDRKRLGDIYENSDQAKLNREEESRLRALGDNTGMLRRLSDQFAAWSGSNPIETTLLGTGGGMLGGLVGQFGGRALGWLFGGGAGAAPAAAAVGAEGTTAAAALGAGKVAGAAGATGILGTLGGLLFGGAGVAAMGGAVYSAASGKTVDGRRLSGTERAQSAVSSLMPGSAFGEMLAQIPGAIQRGLAQSSITATVDPHVVNHAESKNATPRGRR